jgi:hypothetical protein
MSWPELEASYRVCNRNVRETAGGVMHIQDLRRAVWQPHMTCTT